MNAATLKAILMQLETLDADLAEDREAVQSESDIDLIECGYLLTHIAGTSRTAQKRIEAETVRRMDGLKADRLAHDYATATREWKHNYDRADVHAIAQVLPARDVDGYLEFVPAQQPAPPAAIPAHWRIKSTVSFKNYIKKLGESPLAADLTRLLNQQDTLKGVVFDVSNLDGWAETVEQLAGAGR